MVEIVYTTGHSDTLATVFNSFLFLCAKCVRYIIILFFYLIINSTCLEWWFNVILKDIYLNIADFTVNS